MATTYELILDELETSARELLQYGEHEGACTNAAQTAVATKIAPCTKHQKMLKQRELRFNEALDQIKMLRDVFKGSPGAF